MKLVLWVIGFFLFVYRGNGYLWDFQIVKRVTVYFNRKSLNFFKSYFRENYDGVIIILRRYVYYLLTFIFFFGCILYYVNLNGLSIKLFTIAGVLLLFNCFSFITNDEFSHRFEILMKLYNRLFEIAIKYLPYAIGIYIVYDLFKLAPYNIPFEDLKVLLQIKTALLFDELLKMFVFKGLLILLSPIFVLSLLFITGRVIACLFKFMAFKAFLKCRNNAFKIISLFLSGLSTIIGLIVML